MFIKVFIYLKRGSRKGKKEKFRDLLFLDMISSSLGDFRYIIYIGSGGGSDMFGDIFFLQGKFYFLFGIAVEGFEEDGIFDFFFQFIRTVTLYGQEFFDGSFFLFKNVIFFLVIGGFQVFILFIIQVLFKFFRLYLEIFQFFLQFFLQEVGSVDIWRISEVGSVYNGLIFESGVEEFFLFYVSFLFSLYVDLGFFILDDVFQIMDQDLGYMQIFIQESRLVRLGIQVGVNGGRQGVDIVLSQKLEFRGFICVVIGQ